MGLNYSAVGHRVNVGSAAALDNLGAMTIMAWVRPSSITGAHSIMSKCGFSGGFQGWRFELNADLLSFTRKRATSNYNLIATNNALVVDTWRFVAFRCASGPASGVFFTGTPTARATAAATETVGSGTVGDDASYSLLLGGDDAVLGYSWAGDIGPIAIANSALSTAVIEDWQFNPRNMSTLLGFWRPGLAGTSTQPDLSGKGNNGTVTGCAVSANPPCLTDLFAGVGGP